ncbi:MAG TPA: hypothetical protein VIV11_35315, partial [Kofleriaceae bacterium]
MRTLVVLLVAACGAKAPPPPPDPVVQHEAAPPAAPEPPARIDYEVGESPMSVVVAGDRLVWTDSTGAIWTMPVAGGQPKQLSDQHGTGFMFHPVVAGGEVYVSGKRD